MEYVNPTKGRWLPANALGVGNGSMAASFSTSSKFRVSSSPERSWTMGGTQLRMVLKFHWSFLKNGCDLTSSEPLKPRRDSLKGTQDHYKFFTSKTNICPEK